MDLIIFKKEVNEHVEFLSKESPKFSIKVIDKVINLLKEKTDFKEIFNSKEDLVFISNDCVFKEDLSFYDNYNILFFKVIKGVCISISLNPRGRPFFYIGLGKNEIVTEKEKSFFGKIKNVEKEKNVQLAYIPLDYSPPYPAEHYGIGTQPIEDYNNNINSKKFNITEEQHDLLLKLNKIVVDTYEEFLSDKSESESKLKDNQSKI